MKNSYKIVFVLLLLTSSYFSQSTKKYIDKEWIFCEKSKAAGYCEINFDNNSNKNGYVKIYDLNNKLGYEGGFSSTNPLIPHGVGTIYWGSDDFIFSGIETNTYNHGIKDGPSTHYYSSGELKIDQFYKNGELDGTQTKYYKNGNVKSIKEYAIGEHNGRYLTYHENGKIEIEAHNKNGEFDGLWVKYNTDGQVIYEILYSDGLYVTGSYETYYYDGSIKTSVNYKRGERNGGYVEYYRNGNKKVTGWYTKGKKDGSFSFYNSDGQVEYKASYKDKILDGYVTIYYSTGETKLVGYYKNGKKDGIFRWYDRFFGENTYAEEWKEGKLIYSKKFDSAFNIDDFTNALVAATVVLGGIAMIKSLAESNISSSSSYSSSNYSSSSNNENLPCYQIIDEDKVLFGISKTVYYKLKCRDGSEAKVRFNPELNEPYEALGFAQLSRKSFTKAAKDACGCW